MAAFRDEEDTTKMADETDPSWCKLNEEILSGM
jgi:hypothetical protein